MQLFFAPPDRGWLLVRPTTHAVLFWSDDGSWSDTPAGARLFSDRLVAERAARRLGDDVCAMHGRMLDWLKAPIVRITERLVTA